MIKFTDEQKAVVWLNSVLGLSSGIINKLCDIAPLKSIVFNYGTLSTKDKLCVQAALKSNKLLPYEKKILDDLLDTLANKKIGVVIPSDNEYPKALLEIAYPPAMLYYIGDIDFLLGNTLGVVGSREPSRYGMDITESFVNALAKSELVIVSGLARGIDSIAHRTALENDGKTVAVLGCGIDVVFPAENVALYNKIAEKGLVISEYGIGILPSPFRFPERNRIISGLSKALLVTEAGVKSGSLITADFAIKQGRDVFVIPSAITNKRGMGSNQFLQEVQGAMVLSPDDIVERMGITSHREAASTMQIDFTEQIILDALSISELHFEQLLQVSRLGIADLNALLTRMELSQLVKKLDNNYYGV